MKPRQFFSPLRAQPLIAAVSLPRAFVAVAGMTAVVAATLALLRRLA